MQSTLADRLDGEEMQLVRLLARGLNNREIAACLSIAPVEVRARIAGVLEKLGLHDRLELAIVALRDSECRMESSPSA